MAPQPRAAEVEGGEEEVSEGSLPSEERESQRDPSHWLPKSSVRRWERAPPMSRWEKGIRLGAISVQPQPQHSYHNIQVKHRH